MVESILIGFDRAFFPEKAAWAVWSQLVLMGEESLILPAPFLATIGQEAENPKEWLSEQFKALSGHWFRITHGAGYSFIPMIEHCEWVEDSQAFKVYLTPKLFEVLNTCKHAYTWSGNK